MSRKITGIRLDIRDGTVSVRALSKNLRGSAYALRGRPAVPRPVGKSALKRVVEREILALLKDETVTPL